MAEIARYSFHVNSNKRNSGTNTDFTLQLSQVISRLAKNSHFQATIHGATIPFSFYQLSADINTVTVTITQGSNIFVGTLTMTVGNYSTVSVLAELSSRLTTICSGLISPCTSFTPTFDFVYSTTTGKSTLALLTTAPNTSPVNTSSIGLQFATNLSLGLFFGFTSSPAFSIGLPATGSQPAVANPVTTLYIRSPSLRQYKNREWIVSSDEFSDILYRVPVTTSVNTYINFYGEAYPVTLVNDTITSVNFYITTNLTFAPINLQQLPWSFHWTIIEILQPNYDSLFSTAFINQTFPNAPQETDATAEELQQLEVDRQDALMRIERYKKKLIGRGKLKNEEE